jgi:ComF family protein
MLAAFGSTTTLCAVCRRWGGLRVCAACVASHADDSAARCPRCALRLPVPSAPCVECLRDAPPQMHTVCAVDYGFPWDTLLRRLKFEGQVDLARPLGRLLAQAIAAAATPDPDLVTAVPLSPTRLASRGYNQAWLIARQVAAVRKRPIVHLLERHLDTPEQASLDRAQRLANLRSAFGVPSAAQPRLRGRRVALVDDVMTTGATVAECAGTLLSAGAAEVQVWAVARTPAG